jgi:ribosomal protein S18 acetylase RimI-like enzyme
MNISISLATIKDGALYKEIRTKAIKDEPDAYGFNTPEKIEEALALLEKNWEIDISHRDCFVILIKNNFEAVGMTRAVRMQKGWWLVRAVYLKPEFRKSAVGGSLAEEMLQRTLGEIRQRKGNVAKLAVLRFKKNAISLYTKIGFKRVNLIKSLLFWGGKISLLKKWKLMKVVL